MFARLLSACLLAAGCRAQPLPGTDVLVPQGDPALRMVEGIKQWLVRDAPAAIPRRGASVERFRYIIGAVDTRVRAGDLELVATLRAPAERRGGPGFTVRAVRWPVLEGVSAEGLLFTPAARPVGSVVVIPDAGVQPEESLYAQRLARAGFEVLAPVLIDRADTWSGIPAFRMTNQPHREYLYRMAFPVGRHIIGYEVEKVLAAVDWFAQTAGGRPIGVSGYGEGGLIAFYAGALDSRIGVTEVSGYFGPRGGLGEEPVYRNVWSLVRDFGDAEIAALYRGRRLVVDDAPGPVVDGPPPEREGRRGAAPGRLRPFPAGAVRGEVERARKLGAPVQMRSGWSAFAAGADAGEAGLAPIPAADPAGRMRRQFQELVDYTARLVRGAQQERDRYWATVDRSTPARWRETAAPFRERVLDDVIGQLPPPSLAAHPRTRLSWKAEKWDGYEVTLDLFPGVFAYGVLLVPKARRPGERLPLVVAQHGLNGRPQDMFHQPPEDKPGGGFHYYQNIGSRLADLGFAVYMPQNPYIGDFRPIVRLANPYGLSLYSFILAQNRRLLDWLATLDFVDPARIGFYGLSYGGKVALRIPALEGRYALSICSGDFNEWIHKLATVEDSVSYLLTQEYDMLEWNLGHIASHAELAWLIAPRPFMVERGHDDTVGTDEWVAHEYARVRRFYDQMGIGDRTGIEYFNGPHQIHGAGTVEFLRHWLRLPQ